VVNFHREFDGVHGGFSFEAMVHFNTSSQSSWLLKR